MRHSLTAFLALALAVVSVSACSTVSTNSLPVMSREQQAFVAQVKPGMTRAELEKHFYLNAAMWDPNNAPYALRHEDRDGTTIKIKVGCRPKNMSADVYLDPKRHLRWVEKHPNQGMERPDDVVTTVSKPYREQPDTSID